MPRSKDTKYYPVLLEWDGTKINVYPDKPIIWKSSNKKLKGIRWTVIDNQATADTELAWELRYKPNSTYASGNYFGDLDIDCGDNCIEKKPTKPNLSKMSWPYSIEVFDCSGGKKKSLYKMDPRVKWGD